MLNENVFSYIPNQVIQEKIRYKKLPKITAIKSVNLVIVDYQVSQEIFTTYINNQKNQIEIKRPIIEDDLIVHNENDDQNKYVINQKDLIKFYDKISDNIYKPKEIIRTFYQINENIKFLSAWDDLFNLLAGGMIFETNNGFGAINPEKFKNAYKIVSIEKTLEEKEKENYKKMK
mgnify:CR=1 FL=1